MVNFQDWQHASLLNQLIANVDKDMKGGYYELEMRLTSRQLDQLDEIARVFDALARAQGGAPPIKDEGGD